MGVLAVCEVSLLTPHLAKVINLISWPLQLAMPIASSSSGRICSGHLSILPIILVLAHSGFVLGFILISLSSVLGGKREEVRGRGRQKEGVGEREKENRGWRWWEGVGGRTEKGRERGGQGVFTQQGWFCADRIFRFYHIAKNSARTACFIEFISIRPHAVSVLAFVPIFLEQSASVWPLAPLFLVYECFSGRSKKVTKKQQLIDKQI